LRILLSLTVIPKERVLKRIESLEGGMGKDNGLEAHPRQATYTKQLKLTTASTARITIFSIIIQSNSIL